MLTGCASDGFVGNRSLTRIEPGTGYSLQAYIERQRRQSPELSLALAFSGGGARAAALSYGVLQELRDTRVVIDGRQSRLLDAVNLISSVSGGSFTSAYYGLYGDRVFADFESRFLRRDVEAGLVRGLLDPLRWFAGRGRTDVAAGYYRELLFGDATFADLMRPDAPMLLINASDLGLGVRFTFVQEYFNLLCSDLTSFPLARAVTASSAVPVIFDPVVVENHDGCDKGLPSWLQSARQQQPDDVGLDMLRDDDFYGDKSAHRYAHFVDGGVTDNLGLRALLETLEAFGRAQDGLRQIGVTPPRRLAVISVNASVDPRRRIDVTALRPTIDQTLTAVTLIQMRRYDADSLQATRQSLARWSTALSTPEQPVQAYFIHLSFEDVPDRSLRRYLNEIPTNLSLSPEQIDRLIAAGRALLRHNAQFRALVASLGGQLAAAGPATAP